MTPKGERGDIFISHTDQHTPAKNRERDLTVSDVAIRVLYDIEKSNPEKVFCLRVMQGAFSAFDGAWFESAIRTMQKFEGYAGDTKRWMLTARIQNNARIQVVKEDLKRAG